MSYFDMPPSLRQAIDQALGMEVSEGLAQNWNLLVMGCMIFGLVVIINSMMSFYKRYRFNDPKYAEGALLKFVAGILLVNINWVIMVLVEFVI